MLSKPSQLSKFSKGTNSSCGRSIACSPWSAQSVCTSVKEVICHGVPDAYELKEGDICNIDVTVYKDGFHGDLNETYFVGEVSEETKHLVQTAYEALFKVIIFT